MDLKSADPGLGDERERERSRAGVFLLRDFGVRWAMLLSRHIAKHVLKNCRFNSMTLV